MNLCSILIRIPANSTQTYFSLIFVMSLMVFTILITVKIEITEIKLLLIAMYKKNMANSEYLRGIVRIYDLIQVKVILLYLI